MNIHLICNAHLDPVWLWELEEGIGEALSTFRIAVDFCEQYDSFVFNHNEAILYQWVKEYDPGLFERIRELVDTGRWHIMGGWYLQPDCNMPSGEAMLRQIGEGRAFFFREFGVIPTVAINFDPFGHSQGLVSLMAAFGYEGYIITRPSKNFLELPDEYFTWEGFEGSRIRVIRRDEYNSQYGQAAEAIERMIEDQRGKPVVPILWGIGNHGGGPSKKDLDEIAELSEGLADSVKLIHSTPERALKELSGHEEFPLVARDLNPWAPGCYTSQIRVKQQYRRLEELLFWCEAASVLAHSRGLIEYPEADLREAQRVMLTTQFHDILPGSSIRAAEQRTLQMISSARELLEKIRQRCFFTLALDSFSNPGEGIPILVFNPLPYQVESLIDCEFQPARQNWEEERTIYSVKDPQGKLLSSQMEKEASNLNLDWRKRIIFKATLPASSMKMFICTEEKRVPAGQMDHRSSSRTLEVGGDQLRISFDTEVGLPVSIRLKGSEFISAPFGLPTVFSDSPDPWGSRVRGYTEQLGSYSPAAEGPQLRIIEKGEVRTVIESRFTFGRAEALLSWMIPTDGMYVDLKVVVTHSLPDTMLKLAIPVRGEKFTHRGQTIFGSHSFAEGTDERVSQRWQSVANEEGQLVGVLDDGIYGSHLQEGTLYLSLLHTPCYSALPIGKRAIIDEERSLPRIDTDTREFSFRFLFGSTQELAERLEYESMKFSHPVYALSLFPGTEERGLRRDGLNIASEKISFSALKRSEDGSGYILRLFNSQRETVSAPLLWPELAIDTVITLQPGRFETFHLSKEEGCRKISVMDEFVKNP